MHFRPGRGRGSVAGKLPTGQSVNPSGSATAMTRARVGSENIESGKKRCRKKKKTNVTPMKRQLNAMKRLDQNREEKRREKILYPQVVPRQRNTRRRRQAQRGELNILFLPRRLFRVIPTTPSALQTTCPASSLWNSANCTTGWGAPKGHFPGSSSTRPPARLGTGRAFRG